MTGWARDSQRSAASRSACPPPARATLVSRVAAGALAAIRDAMPNTSARSGRSRASGRVGRGCPRHAAPQARTGLPGTERLPLSGDDHAPEVAVRREVGDGLPPPGGHRVGHRIAQVRAVQGEHRDAVLTPVDQDLIHAGERSPRHLLPDRRGICRGSPPGGSCPQGKSYPQAAGKRSGSPRERGTLTRPASLSHRLPPFEERPPDATTSEARAAPRRP